MSAESDQSPRFVYWLQMISGFGPSAKVFAVVFECSHASVDDINAELRQHGTVSGSRLETTDDGKGGRLIRNRTGFLFGVAGLATVQTYHKKCWEPAE
ncbi:hypothetical protein FJ872_19520 [Mesorhizobium sp. B2-5-9]|uniref:hypothetical protein n=1 Tax=Mesorhizobium sp. B2-5-9 TaxID=2589921 RepID=UPI00112DD55D|nr:hypothetical protein [Mesorhizobium sp. B2-5-9]TPK15187.1 hypothetical protein FJ872_19520 [Mesorhizobium sp. B2-5-9]